MKMPYLTLLLLLLIVSGWTDGIVNTTFKVHEDSRLFLEGTSNVKKFTCHCEKDFGTYPLKMEAVAKGQGIHFTNTKLEFPATSLNCGHRAINKDMYETLKADEFSTIQVSILEAWHTEGSGALDECADWTRFRAKARLYIAGIERDMWMEVKGKSIGNKGYRFVSSEELSLADYCLEPPSPMMGLIKVHDCITIHFDLSVEVR
jgi:hypothetical protein